MPWKRWSRLLAGTVMPATLAVAGLAIVGAAPAAAAPFTTTYSCAFPVVGNVPVPVSLDLTGLPSSLPAGVPVPAGSVPVDAVFTLPSPLLALLLGATGLQGRVPDLPVLVGGQAVPAPLTAPLTPVPLLGDLALPATGSLGSFTPAEPGDLPVTLPTSFNLSLLDQLGLPLALLGPVVPCTLTTPGTNTAGTVKVVKQSPTGTVQRSSTTRAKVLGAPVTTGERARLKVKVRSAGGTATGRVVAKLRGKKVATAQLKRGAARLRLPALAAGTWKVKVAYLGDPATAPSTKVVTVRVVP